jgi:hypothetical protein
LDGGGVTRPTRIGYADRNQRLYGGPGVGGAIGYDPGVIVGEPTEPTDPADTAEWFIPYETSADPAVVQTKRSPLSAVNVATTTLDAAPTPGNKLVAFIPLRNADGYTVALSGTGWALVEPAYAGPGASDWPCYLYERTVQPGDGAVWTATSSATASFAMWIVELEGVSALDASDASSDASTQPTMTLTPVTSDPIIILSFVSLRRDIDTGFTPATGMDEIVDDHIATLGTNGPQVAINYQVDLSPSGSYTVGSTWGTGNYRAVIAASFVGASGDVVYLNAFNVNDDDDATFEYVDVTQLEFLRGQLADPVVLSAIRLRVGLENSGSTTIEVFGANEADFSDEVSLDSTTFTATGSYTAQDVAFSLPATTGYLYLRFELGSAQGIHPHEVELTALSTSGGVTDHGDLTGLADNDHPQYALDTDFDAHLADTTDAHDASAVSFDPTGLANTSATDVQEAIEDLDGAISGGGIPATIVDVKGDLIVATAADTVARLAAGANGSSLVAASGEASGLKWRLHNDGASTAPTVNDDSGDGYTVGSRWLDTTADKEYVCLDATGGAAVWVETTATGGGGLTQAYVGYNTVGGSWESMTNVRVIAKQVTIGTACQLENIDVYVQMTNTASSVGGVLQVGVYSDNSGTPDMVIGMNTSVANSLLMDNNVTGGATGINRPRWLAIPCDIWLPAGDYWLAVQPLDITDGIQIAYDGSGGDRYYLSSGAWFADWGFYTPTTTTNRYSIRGNTIR